MRSFKRFVGVEEEEPTLAEQLDQCCSLTLKQRVIGFVVCSGIGLVLSIMSVFFIFDIVLNPARFAILYTLGNIVMICSTGFLVGPLRQIKNMFAPTRAVATIIFLVAMIFTIVAAVKLRIAVLVILALIIQFLALAWYVLSPCGVPYAQPPNPVRNSAYNAKAVADQPCPVSPLPLKLTPLYNNQQPHAITRCNSLHT